MAKFKQVPQSYLFCKLLEFWGNLVRNYRDDCRDNDFFDVIRNSFDHDQAVELIEAAYAPDELEAMKHSSRRSCRLDLDEGLDEVFQVLWNNERSRRKCREVLGCICEYLTERCEKSNDDAVEKRFRELTRTMKLSDLEAEILMFAYLRNQTCFCWPCRVEDREKPLYYAMAIDRSYAEVSKVLSPKGRLRKYGLLDDDWDFNSRALGNFMDGTESEAISRRFYKKTEMEDVLPWEFYGELSEKDGTVICDLIAASKGKCNILLYGEPGTGKTSFARTIARRLGVAAYEIKQGEDDGSNMTSESRMIGIQIANYQEDPSETLLIVDEADELLRGSSTIFSLFDFSMGGKSTEKGVMNGILDEMKLPAIWICNAPAEQMDESVRRRFDYSICFERMNNAQRVSIWKNLVKKYKLSNIIPSEKIGEYASKYETSAGGISTILANVKKMNPTEDKVEELIAKLMKPHCRLMGLKEMNRFLPAKGYSLDGLNIKGKVRLEKVVKAVGNYLDSDFNEASEDKPRMNLLLFGPPGTGKSEFIKYLGKTLDRKVLVVKGSDLLSKWVGESEQNIASAFRRAEAEHAILFFDEVDGLVQSRDNAHASWEVTQVNELLQQMENFDGVMVAATNFCKNLDAAIMRRFTFKLEFDYLDDDGKRVFFEKMFKSVLSDEEFAELKEIPNLAPGDFRTVRQEQFYLGGEQTNLDRIAALKEECALKKDGSKTSHIGFAA